MVKRAGKSIFHCNRLMHWLLISMLISGCAGSPDRMANRKKTVHIAANLPLTSNFAVYGEPFYDGMMMAIDDLKKNDPDGPQLIIDWQDNAGSPGTAISIAQKQLFQSPDIYTSGVHPQAMAIKEMIAAKGIPHLIWIFDLNLNKNDKGVSVANNCFRTWVNLKIEPPVFFDYVKAHKPKRIAITYVRLAGNTEAEYQNLVVPGLKKMGIKDILVEPFDASQKDFKDIAAKVQNFHPDLIIFSGFPNNEVAIVRAFRPLGLIKDGNTLSSYDLLDTAKTLDKNELEGIRLTVPAFVTHSGKEPVKQWIERLQARTHRVPLYSAAYAYDSIMIIHDSAKRLQLPASPQQWIEALRATKLNGVTGPLSFDDDGSLTTPVELAVFRNGKIVPDNSNHL